MNLTLNDDQVMIRDAAEQYLADASTSEAVRAAMASEQGFDSQLWQTIGSELGWCGIGIGEEHGGLGLGPVELALVMEQAGRRLLCAPFFATVCLGANLLQTVGADEACGAWLEQIALGKLRLGVPLPSDVDWTACAHTLHAKQGDGQWLLDGEVGQVVDGASAELLLLPAELEDGTVGLFALAADAQGLSRTATPGWDATRRFASVQLQQVVAQRCDNGERGNGFERAAALARLYMAAEQLGCAQQCLDLTVAYVAERKQFGRPVGGFQAVKHRCAQMLVQVEALRSAVYGAAATAALNTLMAECAMARTLAVEAAFFCAQEAIQLHGGVGFTWEYDPQLYFKRAQASSHWLGSADALREQLATAQFAGTLSPGPSPTGGRGEEAFRAEVAGWLNEHLSGRFAVLKHRGGPGDEEAYPVLRKEWEKELAAGGWACVGWPEQHGGRGLSIDQQVVFHEEYARAGAPGHMGHIGEGLIGPTLIAFGDADQQRRHLLGIRNGEVFWSQGYSEPGAGSDLANVQTKCWQEADGSWRVQGQKIWTSLAHESDWIFVLARSEPGSKGRHGLTFLLLPLNQPGIEIRGIRQLSGSAEFNEVFFDGAVAAANDVVGAPGDGWKVAMGLLEAERGVSTLGQQMHFAHELDMIVAAARDNGQVSNAQIRQRIAQAWCGLRVMRYNALRMLAGEATGLRREALIYKYYWSNWHRDLGKLAMDVLGPVGDVPSDVPNVRRLQQIFFFSRSDTIYAGTNEIQLNLMAERGLGLPREARPGKT